MSGSDHITWIKAAASASSGNCVELGVSDADSSVFVRDSKNPAGPIYAFTRAAIGVWLDGARNGEFDHLARRA